jgi:hypothetical protein
MTTIDPQLLNEVGSFCAKFRTDPSMELEVVLADRVKGYKGIDHDDFFSLQAALNRSVSNNIFTSSGKQIVTDHFYEGNLRRRTRAEYVEVVRKTKVASIDIICPQRTGLRLRVNLKREEKVSVGMLAYLDPVQVRLKELWQFNYKGRYSYDLSKVASGNTQTINEVELELMRGQYLNDTTNEELAWNILHKSADLLGQNSVGPLSLVTNINFQQ